MTPSQHKSKNMSVLTTEVEVGGTKCVVPSVANGVDKSSSIVAGAVDGEESVV